MPDRGAFAGEGQIPLLKSCHTHFCLTNKCECRRGYRNAANINPPLILSEVKHRWNYSGTVQRVVVGCMQAQFEASTDEGSLYRCTAAVQEYTLSTPGSDALRRGRVELCLIPTWLLSVLRVRGGRTSRYPAASRLNAAAAQSAALLLLRVSRRQRRWRPT